jgi:hypothetical protein
MLFARANNVYELGNTNGVTDMFHIQVKSAHSTPQ